MNIKHTESYTIKAVREMMLQHKHSGPLYTKIYSYAGKDIEDTFNLIKENKTALASLSRLNAYDGYTFSHSVNVFSISIMIGSLLGLNKNRLLDLGAAALFHDIGKTSIPKSILNKKTQLSNHEFALIKTHATKGSLFAKDNIAISDTSYRGILHHHEKYDGTGYPDGIKGEFIDLFGRIISIADVYDAMTSERPYRKALSHTEAIEFIYFNRGKNFDPEIVNIFLAFIDADSNLAHTNLLF